MLEGSDGEDDVDDGGGGVMKHFQTIRVTIPTSTFLNVLQDCANQTTLNFLPVRT
jgi:hypothetical protein